MTLRTRLTTAFLLVVLGPVLLGAVFVGSTVAAVSRDRAEHQLDLATSATRSAIAAMCQRLRTVAEAVALYPAEDRNRIADELVARGLADAVRVPAVGRAGEPDLVTAAAPTLPWADCAGPSDTGRVEGDRYGAVAARIDLPDGSSEVWAAVALDAALVERLATAAGVEVVLLAGAYPALPADEVGELPDGRLGRRLEPAEGQPLPLLLTADRTPPPGLYPLLTAVVVLAGLVALLAAWHLARSTTRPVGELSRAADQIAGGDLSVRVPVRGADEAGRLAATFNRMAHRTEAYVKALTASRDQLRRHLAVLGDTLSSTHDLDRILRVILGTALAATGARFGAALLLDQETGALVGHRSQSSAPLPPGGAPPWEQELQVPLGSGLLGAVAATGEARRGRVIPDGPALHEAEPQCATYVVVPISAPGGVSFRAAPWPAPPNLRGVLAVYDRLGADEFDDTDLVTLRTFAGQAGVAVDNVRTHEEAQRLSLTDSLTGLWNYRYLRESLRREVERASRFRHTLAVLALDLDRFKEINDGYGHPAGDAVLAEFARRIRSEIREVDLAFRQGGEEFVVLLPETDARGAAVLARRLGAAVRDAPVVVAPRAPGGERLAVDVTVSLGIAVYPDHALTPRALLDAADEALYAAKEAGRDTYQVATATPEPVAAAELAVRGAARVPDDDLPRAGARASGATRPPRQPGGRQVQQP